MVPENEVLIVDFVHHAPVDRYCITVSVWTRSYARFDIDYAMDPNYAIVPRGSRSRRSAAESSGG